MKSYEDLMNMSYDQSTHKIRIVTTKVISLLNQLIKKKVEL